MAINNVSEQVTKDVCGHQPKDKVEGFCPECGHHLPGRFTTREVRQDFYDLWEDALCSFDYTDGADGSETWLPNRKGFGYTNDPYGDERGAKPFPKSELAAFKLEYQAELKKLDVRGLTYEVREGIVCYYC